MINNSTDGSICFDNCTNCVDYVINFVSMIDISVVMINDFVRDEQLDDSSKLYVDKEHGVGLASETVTVIDIDILIDIFFINFLFSDNLNIDDYNNYKVIPYYIMNDGIILKLNDINLVNLIDCSNC